MNDEDTKMQKITIDGVDYAPVSPPTGTRAICVLDRGWIFVGHLEKDDAGRFTLRNVANIRKWGSGGYGGLTTDPKASGVNLAPCADIVFDPSAMIFSTPVSDDWGE